MSLYGTFFFIILAILAGMMIPTQAAVNNRLAADVEGPVLAALFTFVTGSVALFAYTLVAGIPLSGLGGVRNASFVSLTGGLIGAFFVTVTIILIPRLGVALTFSLVVAGQMLITLVLDHYGLLGVPVRELNFQRILGVGLVIAGVVLVRRF